MKFTAASALLVTLIAGRAGEGPGPVIWWMTPDCRFHAADVKGAHVLDSEPLAPACTVHDIGFGAGEATVLLIDANKKRRAWRITSTRTERLAPAVDEIELAAYTEDGRLLILGRIAGGNYGAVRSRVSSLIPGDPGCRLPYALVLTPRDGGWKVLEENVGDCQNDARYELPIGRNAGFARMDAIQDVPWPRDNGVISWQLAPDGTLTVVHEGGKPAFTEANVTTAGFWGRGIEEEGW